MMNNIETALTTVLKFTFETMPEAVRGDFTEATEALLMNTVIQEVLFTKRGFNYRAKAFQPVPNALGKKVPFTDNETLSMLIGKSGESDMYISSIIMARYLKHLKVLSS